MFRAVSSPSPAWTSGGAQTGPDHSCLDRIAAICALALLYVSAIAAMTTDPAGTNVRTAPPLSVATAPTRETMIAAYMGAPYTYPSDVVIKKPGKHDLTIHQVEWRGEPFNGPIYYGVRVAHWLEGGRNGVMLDFTHSKALGELDQVKKFSGTLNNAPAPPLAKIRDIFRKLEASHGHNMLTLNGLFRLPSIGARLSPYVGLGGGISLPHSEVHFVGEEERTYEYQFAGPVAQALFGIELRLPQLSYFLEYKFTWAPYTMPLSNQEGYILWTDLWRQFQNWRAGKQPVNGTLTTTFTSHQIIGGLGVRVVPHAAVPASR